MGHNIVVKGIEEPTFHVFSGGQAQGRCLQITHLGHPYLVLDTLQVRELVAKLQVEWEIDSLQATLHISRQN